MSQHPRGAAGRGGLQPDGRVLAAGGAEAASPVDGDGQRPLATLGTSRRVAAGRVRQPGRPHGAPPGRRRSASGTWPARTSPAARDGAVRADRLAFAPNGRLCRQARATTPVWDLRSGRRTAIDTGGPVEAIAALPDGRVLSLGRRGASLWGRDGRTEASYPLKPASRNDLAPGEGTGAIAVSPSGKRLAMTRQGAGTEVWDLGVAGRACRALRRRRGGACGPADETLAIVNEFGAVEVHTVPAPKAGDKEPPAFGVPVMLAGHAGEAAALARRGDGSIATAGEDGRVILWTTSPNTTTFSDPSIDGARRVAFSGDGRRLLVADRDGIALFDCALPEA